MVLVSDAPAGNARLAPTAVRHVIYLVVVDLLLSGRTRIRCCPLRCTLVLRLVCLYDLAVGLGQLVLRLLALILLEVQHLYICIPNITFNDRLETTIGFSGSYRITARQFGVYRIGPGRPKPS